MIFRLSKELIFPDVTFAEPDGLLAVGGDLRPERLILAYQSGIFPWFNEPPILWWSPDPRFVLFPESLKVSASMKQVLKKNTFRITYNQNFAGVIRNCRKIERVDQDGTWITGDMEAAYIRLHEMKIAMSVEAWQGDELVGGLYGIRLGRAFFGESMFAKVSNASKAAFITFVQDHSHVLGMIDCQVETHHLRSLGADFIPRSEFLRILETLEVS
ncbi:leucyl/phenylalanyl-tRNA--protein transferase [Chitinophaga jiangningensis]|uniref:Leucyl/phenylalanyl-tRNA--protein transferase n=1 Tax=Chitinophaga jiangningensis TaxID=1419482 RepID=A0A1M6VFY9_9BACT|nr:leucyl/phenylalanyl-tRNA--protein transferase [Chitinophaga jiangningensis]SHK80433.1 leucyl/phenylalanyl-tRNA--protein transferase [Chitinophaga jiangningensis]